MKDLRNYTVRTAESIVKAERLHIDASLPLAVTGLTEDNAAAVRAKLTGFYPDAALEALGGGKGEAVLHPAALTEKQRFSFGDLLSIMDILRGENGCEWDKVQTHQSIKKNILEEAAEAAEAIDGGDTAHMCEEFGDLLLQPVFQSVIAEEAGEFTVSDMITALCMKLISRHTHVFGGEKAATPEEALNAWKKAKEREKERNKK